MQSFTKQTTLPLSTQFLCVCVCAQVAMPGHYTDDVREAGQSATFASNRDTPCHPPLVILIVHLCKWQIVGRNLRDWPLVTTESLRTQDSEYEFVNWKEPPYVIF